MHIIQLNSHQGQALSFGDYHGTPTSGPLRSEPERLAGIADGGWADKSTVCNLHAPLLSSVCI